MFPNDISTVVCFAIKNREWKTAAHFLSELYGWMDCPDYETGVAAAHIADVILDVTTEDKSKDVEVLKLHNTWLKRAVSLVAYAKISGVYKQKVAV